MISANAYRLRDRVIVHYYDTGKKNHFHCPECHWKGSAGRKDEGAVEDAAICDLAAAHCQELSCPVCGTPLGMLSSRLLNFADRLQFI